MSSLPTQINPTSLETARANSLVAAKWLSDRLNEDLTRTYYQNFEGWAIEVRAGKRKPDYPPLSPSSYAPKVESTGFWYPAATGDPVCPMPEIPVDNTREHVNERGSVDVIGALPTDPSPEGAITTGAELIRRGAKVLEVGASSSVWRKFKRGTPFGPVGWWMRVEG